MTLGNAQALEMDQLENVAGGTWDETFRLTKYVILDAGKRGYSFMDFFEEGANKCPHIADETTRSRTIWKNMIEIYLKKVHNVIGNCDIGDKTANVFSYQYGSCISMIAHTDDIINKFLKR